MMTIEEIKAAAAGAAAALQAAGGAIPDDARARVVAVRAELFRRGVFDPVLVRFDSATVARASNEEIAAELTKIAESL